MSRSSPRASLRSAIGWVSRRAPASRCGKWRLQPALGSARCENHAAPRDHPAHAASPPRWAGDPGSHHGASRSQTGLHAFRRCVQVMASAGGTQSAILRPQEGSRVEHAAARGREQWRCLLGPMSMLMSPSAIHMPTARSVSTGQ
jgi:hypothetical protein